jgi:hypothetical protein
MSDVKNEMLTITMTDRPPVRVNKKIWDLVAQSKDWDGEYECQANRHWKISVRQCQNEGDDRCVVYGSYDTSWGDNDIRAGVIVENIDDAPRAIKEIAEQIGANSLLAQRCIASLPAEEI